MTYLASDLSRTIRQTVEIYESKGVPVEDIGNGWCEEFAYDVMKKWIGNNWNIKIRQEDYPVDTIETFCFMRPHEREWDWSLLSRDWDIFPGTKDERLLYQRVAHRHPNHVWIVLNKRHYDAESPDGESSFFELKFFERWIDKARRGELQ